VLIRDPFGNTLKPSRKGGTEGSNPNSSTGESSANLTLGDACGACEMIALTRIRGLARI
jgi:hypothetical protein